jgi:hypothetical protein
LLLVIRELQCKRNRQQIMEICSKPRLLVLVVLLLGLVVTTAAPAYGSKVEEVSSADAESKAGETQWNVESWTDWAKEKLRVVTDTASKESDANTKDAKGAASKAGDTASGSLFYLFITQLFVRSWIVIMVIFGSELWVSRVSMGSIHFLFSGTEAAIALLYQN